MKVCNSWRKHRGLPLLARHLDALFEILHLRYELSDWLKLTVSAERTRSVPIRSDRHLSGAVQGDGVAFHCGPVVGCETTWHKRRRMVDEMLSGSNGRAMRNP
jgi:hypothetical protein